MKIKNDRTRDKIFVQLLEEAGLPEPEREYRFHPNRLWKFDFCYPEKYIAIEIEGGIYTKQAHGSITGILRDVEKYTEAAIMGFRIMRVLPEDIHKRSTIEKIRRAWDMKINPDYQITTERIF